MKPSQRGFTLIELMITTAIIAVLAAVAYPSYTRYVIKSNRATAQAQILEIANREQQYLMSARKYANKTEMAATGYTLPTQLTNLYDWDIAVSATTVPSFTITFTPKGPQSNDGNLTYTNEGVKSPADKW
jgi:type IV pilus assembly protein PilE